MDMKNVSREEALLYLMGEHEQLNFVVQQCSDEYERVLATQQGDAFYVRANFTRRPTNQPDQLNFSVGDILHVQDSLYGGQLGTWYAQLLNEQQQPIAHGCIPSERRAQADRQLELQNGTSSSGSGSVSATKSAIFSGGMGGSLVAQCRVGLFRRRRSARRSKSLGKEQWEELMHGSQEPGVLPAGQAAYQRVQHKHPGFIRPIVILGAMADVARQKLLTDYPDKYAAPQRSRGGNSTTTTSTATNSANQNGSNRCSSDFLNAASQNDESESARMLRKQRLAERDDDDDDEMREDGPNHAWQSSNNNDSIISMSGNETGNVSGSTTTDSNMALIRLSSIRAISEQGKHALLDVGVAGVQRLVQAGFCPIVILLKVESKSLLKELRVRYAKGGSSGSRSIGACSSLSAHKSSKKMFEHCQKLEKACVGLAHAAVQLSTADLWYKKLRESIERQQQLNVWMPTQQSNQTLSDDFLVTAGRLSMASSPESDVELSLRETSRPQLPMMGGSGSSNGFGGGSGPGGINSSVSNRLVKACSVPSIATIDELPATDVDIGNGKVFDPMSTSGPLSSFSDPTQATLASTTTSNTQSNPMFSLGTMDSTSGYSSAFENPNMASPSSNAIASPYAGQPNSLSTIDTSMDPAMTNGYDKMYTETETFTMKMSSYHMKENMQQQQPPPPTQQQIDPQMQQQHYRYSVASPAAQSSQLFAAAVPYNGESNTSTLASNCNGYTSNAATGSGSRSGSASGSGCNSLISPSNGGYSTFNANVPEPPPRIDRGSKPNRFRTAHERLFGTSGSTAQPYNGSPYSPPNGGSLGIPGSRQSHATAFKPIQTGNKLATPERKPQRPPSPPPKPSNYQSMYVPVFFSQLISLFLVSFLFAFRSTHYLFIFVFCLKSLQTTDSATQTGTLSTSGRFAGLLPFRATFVVWHNQLLVR